MELLRVKPFVLRVKQKCYYILMYCFTRKTLVGANRVRIHLLSVKQIASRVKPIVLRVKPFVLRLKQKYYYILMDCFTRKTLVGANRVRIHILGVKQIVLRVKPFVLRVKQKYHYILMYCFMRKANCLRVKKSVLRVNHWVNDPFGHKLQITLINVPTFYA